MAMAMSGKVSRVPLKMSKETCFADMENSVLRCGFSSVKGWQKNQENAHLCIIDYDINASLFGVFDGSGGPEVAFCAAEKIPELIKNDFYCNGDYGEALKKAFTDFDQFLLTGEGFKRMKLHHGPVPGRNKRGSDESLNEKLSDQTLFGFTSGSTAMVVLVVDGRRVYMAHVGSSGCLISNRATLSAPYVYATRQHKPMDDADIAKIFEAEETENSRTLDKDFIASRYLGYHLYKKNHMLPQSKQLVISAPELRLEYIEPGKGYYILIACNGIWKTISKYVAVQTINQCLAIPNMNLSSICKYLIKKSLPSMNSRTNISHNVDNMTCILIYCKSPPPVHCIPDKLGDAFDALKF